MSAVLYLDTTFSRLMLGVSRDGEMRAQYTAQTDSHRYHSAMLMPAIQQVLEEAGMTVQDLTALAVNHGPGSFTGIRTGITTARTMGQFLHLPVHVFNTFELLAFDSPEPVAVYLDALRGRTYHAVLGFNASGPIYTQAPRLEMLSTEGPPLLQTGKVTISPSLLSVFESACTTQGMPLQTISESLDTPSPMLALITRYGDHFARSWQEVKPLYLQEPSITLRKK